MGSKQTFEQVVAKASLKHNNKYTYVSMENGKITFICPTHGQITGNRPDHLSGHGCKLCGNSRKNVLKTYTLQEFAKKANETHHSKYEYVALESKTVEYNCKAHGKVVQSRSNHLSGTGCPRCGKTKKAAAVLKFPDIERQCKEVHGDKYAYLEYESGYLVYICPKHGEVLQKAADHIRGYGCAACSASEGGLKRTLGLTEYVATLPEWAKGLTYLEIDRQNVMYSCPSHGLRVQHKYTHKVGLGCVSCSAGQQKSKFSDQVSEWLTSQGVKHILETGLPYKDTTYKADILVDKLVLELNGDYWHSEDKVGAGRHLEKYSLASQAGYDFLMFSDNEWQQSQEVIKRSILSRLGLLPKSVGARKLQVVKLSASDARELLEANHIQGYCNADLWLGLAEASAVVAVAGFSLKLPGRGSRFSPTTCELVRFATSKGVQGGLSRLISHAHKLLGFQTLNSFSDNRFFSGQAYTKVGFKAARQVAPSYYYVKSGNVINKASLQKSRIAKNQNLLYDSSLTEKELAELNGYKRVYDAGKTLWVMSFPTQITSQ